MPRPNILIVVIDSLRRDHVSCCGYDRNTTPNIDRLADEGCVFDSCITAAPFSPASYASIMSGLFPHEHGVNGDTIRVWPDSWPRLPERLKEAGYFTFCVSNNSFLSKQMNGDRGFDAFYGVDRPWWLRTYSRNVGRIRRRISPGLADLLETQSLVARNKGNSDAVVQRAAELMGSGDRPFFGFLVLMDPHALFHPGRREFVRDRRNVRQFLREFNGRKMWPKFMARRQPLDPEMLAAAIDLYDGEIAHADACVGRLYDTLRRTGILDNTVVAVTADHGEAFGEHGVWGHGFGLTDCLTRVPLVVRHPEYWSPGHRAPQIVQLHDLHDLCLNLSDASGSDDSKSDRYPYCLTQAEDPNWSGREAAFSEFPIQTGVIRMMKNLNPELELGRWEKEMWAVRTADWRLIEYDSDDVDLFNLQEDPQERASCHSDHPEIVDSLRRKLATHRGLTSATETVSHSDEEHVEQVVLDRLRDLGYIE